MRRIDLTSKDVIVSAFLNNLIRRSTDYSILFVYGIKDAERIKNFGEKSYRELCEWAGVPYVKRGERVCPHCGLSASSKKNGGAA